MAQQKGGIKRRSLDLAQDYDILLEMEKLSWEINFPQFSFSEKGFRVSLISGVQARYEEIYVYERGNELVGWLWLDLSAPRKGGHIRRVQVKKEYWGQGLGRQILWDAISICAERGCRAVTLNVTKSNERAVRLYTGLGFTVVEDFGERQSMRLEIPSFKREPQKRK